jgi:hypothetical protein
MRATTLEINTQHRPAPGKDREAMKTALIDKFQAQTGALPKSTMMPSTNFPVRPNAVRKQSKPKAREPETLD